MTVTVSITGNGAAAAPQAVTQGISGLDFAVAAGGTCAAGTSYTAGQTCTVSAVFHPKSPGLRTGAIVLLSTNGSVLGISIVTGVGQGSLGVLQPGQIDTVVGTNTWLFHGDGVPATNASIFLPTAVVVDAGGNIYLSDSSNNRLRRVDAVTNLISTVAGNGIPGFSGDGGLAIHASISTPAGLVVDGAGNIFFADSDNHVVRRVDAITNIITTVVGIGGVQGYTGDGGPAKAAKLYQPEGIAFDAAGNLYIADSGNNVVRVVDVSGNIRTIAGTGAPSFSGDGGPATAATLNSPWTIAMRLDGSLFIADQGNNRIRKIDLTGKISTAAGTGLPSYSGDGGPASAAGLYQPQGIAFDPAGNVYISDTANNRIRKINATTGVITSLTGTGGEALGGDGGPANIATVNGPYGLYFDNVTGSLLIADFFHNRIRRISASTITLDYATIRVSKVSPPQAQGFENDGNATLTSVAPILVNAALDPATTTCVTTLATDTACIFGVEFAPTVIGNPVLGAVTVGSDADNNPAIINLSGDVLTVEPTTVTLTSSANPAMQGANVTFTATVQSADTSRGGPVTFLDGTTVICNNVALDATGNATCATSTLTLGSHSITANYAGDANNAAAVSAPLIQVIQETVTLTLTVTPNPATVTQPVQLSVAAAAANDTPAGVITFYDGTTAIGTGTLTAGLATFSTSALSPATHNLTAKYPGNTTEAASTSNEVDEVISEGTTSTTLASSGANVSFGTSVTFTATVIAADGPRPTGIVQFVEGATILGTGTLSNTGVTTFTTSTLAPGSHNIVASYVGDASDGASNSAPLLEVVKQIATTTTLTSSTSSAIAGTAILLTANVSVVAGATPNGLLTGQVTFNHGAIVLGTGTLNASGVATLSVTTLPVGSDSITATYAGDSNYIASNSSSVVEAISVASMTLKLAGPTTVDVATAATFTVLLATTGPTPTGTLSLFDGASLISSQSATAAGTFTFSTLGMILGTHTLTATYTGDPDYSTTTSNLISVVVQQAPSATALISSQNPQIVGQSVILTATVTSDSPNPAGTVSFKDGATSLGSATLNGSGVATFTLSTLTFGTHNLTAIYSGDTNHVTSTSTSLSQRIVEPATIALTSSVNPATASTSVVFTAKLIGTTSPTPTGTVTFLDGATVIGTGTLDATGSAGFSTSSLSVGVHSITASYAGDQNFSTTTSGVLSETIQDASTQIVLSAGANPAIFGTSLTLTAGITTNGAVATGSVTFTDGGTPIGSVLLNGSGVATLTLSTLTPGSHTIVANYSGDNQTGASSSTPFILSVEQITSTSITSSANPALTLASITLTASVTNNSVGVATGNVTFRDGTTLLGTFALDGLGNATVTVPSLSAGNHSIVATYGGDTSNFSSVSSSLVQGVQLRPTVTSLSSVASSPTNAQQVTLISVVHWTGTTAPTGTVTFTSGSQVVGSSAIDASGIANITIFLNSASENIVASYNGDSAYAGSTSLVTSITGAPATQFTLQIDPAAMTVQSKQHGVVNITIASVKGFTDNLEFGCLGLPFAATCTFSKTQMTLAADTTQTIQLTIDTGNPLGSGATATNAHAGSNALLAFLPGGLLVGFLLIRKKRTLPMLSIIVILFGMGAMLAATGCAGLQESGTPPGTYTFKVGATGAGTGANASQTMTLTVTQ